MTATRIPLIYILSSGRSGSTLLDLLLGVHPRVWTVGEAQMLPWELRRPGALCGCGRPFARCPFWAPLLPDLPLAADVPIHYLREDRRANKALRPALLPALWHGDIPAAWRAAAETYGQVNADYLGRVLAAAPGHIHWLVDASKDPYRLHWLAMSGRFDLRVIHLVKDPRAYVYSIVKGQLPYAFKPALVAAARWRLENIIALRLRGHVFAPEHVFPVRYEELASHPTQIMKRIGEWLGLSFSQEEVAGFREQENHGIAGNQMRWECTPIRLDRAWRSQLPRLYARAAWLTTWPLRRRLGY